MKWCTEWKNIAIDGNPEDNSNVEYLVITDWSFGIRTRLND